MSKFEGVNEESFTKDVEDALNDAINQIDVDDELVFAEIKIKRKDSTPDNCRWVRRCFRDSDGNLICRWVQECD